MMHGPVKLELRFSWMQGRWVLAIKDGSIIKRFANKARAIKELRYWCPGYSTVCVYRKNGTIQEHRNYNT
jgi:hypothetical protein